MQYKKTIRIPNTDFPMKADLVKNEKKFKSFWEENDIWTKICSKETEKEYVLHDGPPYANGNIHVGHALNKILKDFVIRYKALKNYRINYIPGWDTHGLPIENKVEKTYGEKTNIEKRKICKEYALQQINIQKSQFKRLHLLTDLNTIYKTMDQEFVDQELEIFLNLFKKKLIYRDLKPVSWSWSSKTALAESEIVYKEIETESIYTWFPAVKSRKNIPKNTRLLIWTTTPYTLEANLAISVNPNFKYELIEWNENFWLILEKTKEKIGLKGQVIEKILGKELEGCEYLNPCTKEINKIICANYVTSEMGTGLVHNAPGFGIEDYYACLEYGIQTYSAIDENGIFFEKTKFEPINGLFYEKASSVVIDWLEEKGYLFKKEVIKHNVGHDWRTEKPIIHRTSYQWFINISTIKETNFLKIDSEPKWLGEKLKKLILARKEWCISRQRVWGIPIPILFDGKEPIINEIQIEYTIGMIKKHGIESWFEKGADFFLHTSIIPKNRLEKSKDILDVWFDSGCSWKILKDKKADLYLEGFDQLRGWFNSSSIISTIVSNQIPFKKLISHGFVLDEKGNKMSKSKGNVIDPLEIVEEYGTDILRLWLGSNDYTEDIKLSKEGLQSAISNYKKIRNTLFRYSISVIPKNIERGVKDFKKAENLYILWLFKKSFKRIETYLEEFKFFRAIKESLNFLNIYSSWYLEICKDTLYCDCRESEEYKETISVIKEVFEKNLIFFSIFIPQTSEEAYKYLQKTDKQQSIFLEKWPTLNYDWEIKEDDWDKFFELKDKVYGEIEKLKEKGILKNTTEASVVLVKEEWMKKIDLLKCLNVGEIKYGERIEVTKCLLEKCLRCQRHKFYLEKNLCNKCLKAISSDINRSDQNTI